MKPVSVLDIGSSKVVCLCGSRVHEDGILVHGVGSASYEGYDGGEFSDPDSLHDAILSAVETAEQQSRSRIREVALSVPATFVTVVNTQDTIRLDKGKKRITQEDIDTVFTEAADKAECADSILMHSVPVCYIIDGEEIDEAPVGEKANELSVVISSMFVKETFVQRFERILSELEIEISMCISATLAQARHVIPPEERVRPAALIDVGYTHTEVCVIENSAVTKLVSFEEGGCQIASDLSFGLDIPLEYAEQVKRRYAFLQEPLSKIELVRMPTGVLKFSHDDIKFIIESRADEIASMIKEALDSMEIVPEQRPVIYLTGGGLSPMHYSGDYLEQKLGMPVKRNIPSYLHEMNACNYTSTFGALDFVFATSFEPQEEPVDAENNTTGSLFSRIRDFFSKE